MKSKTVTWTLAVLAIGATTFLLPLVAGKETQRPIELQTQSGAAAQMIGTDSSPATVASLHRRVMAE